MVSIDRWITVRITLLGPWRGNLYKQVVFIYRWSLGQVRLYHYEKLCSRAIFRLLTPKSSLQFMGILWPQNWKKCWFFLLITVSFLIIETSEIPSIESSYQYLHFNLLHWRALCNSWGHYAKKHESLMTLNCTLSSFIDLFCSMWPLFETTN